MNSVGFDHRALATRVRGRIRWAEPLARHVTYGVGGPAEALVEPADPGDLGECLAFCQAAGIPTYVLGDGSNVLVSDAGLPGVVLKLTAPAFVGLVVEPLEPAAAPGPALRLRVGAGLACGRLVALARAESFADLVFLAGIPGTVGGAVRMNAGTSAGQFSDVLEEVDLALADGSVVTWPAAAVHLDYRRSGLPQGAVVCGARLLVHRGDPAQVTTAIDRYLARRRATQPFGATAGCVFKNPPGDHAGRLIDAAGLKGRTVGGATISPVHANFIVAQPGTSAGDIATLISEVRAVVQQRTGIELELENLLLGFPIDDGQEQGT